MQSVIDSLKISDHVSFLSTFDSNLIILTRSSDVVLRLCNVMADMKEIRQEEFKLMNKRCWQGKKYYNATFSVKVAIAPADLKFELWFNGKKYNRSHDPISIEFDAVGAAAKPRVSIDVAEVDGHAWEGKY